MSPLHISFLTISLSTELSLSLLEAGAHRGYDPRPAPIEVRIGRREELKRPAREKLLDRPVEPHRGDLRIHVAAEAALLLAVGDDLRDALVGAADLREVSPPEGVRRPRDLD